MKQRFLKLWLLFAMIMVSMGSAWADDAIEKNEFTKPENFSVTMPEPGHLHVRMLVSYLDSDNRYWFAANRWLTSDAKTLVNPYIQVYYQNADGSTNYFSLVPGIIMTGASPAFEYKNGTGIWNAPIYKEAPLTVSNYIEKGAEIHYNGPNHEALLVPEGATGKQWGIQSKDYFVTEDNKTFLDFELYMADQWAGRTITKAEICAGPTFYTLSAVQWNTANTVYQTDYSYRNDFPKYTYTLNTAVPGNYFSQAPKLLAASVAMPDDKNIAKPGQMMLMYNSSYSVENISFKATDAVSKKPETDGYVLFNASNYVREIPGARFKVRAFKDCEHIVGSVTSKDTIKVPAYHKIQSFTVQTYVDPQRRRRGASFLSWNISNPNEEDAVKGDLFEIQRATKSDWSDVETIDIVQMDDESIYYSYIDSTEVTLKWQSQGSNNKVYYRVRRASASVWDWADLGITGKGEQTVSDGFAVCAIRNEHVVQRDFADVKATKAPDWATSRKVHITATLPKVAYTWHDGTAPVSLVRTVRDEPQKKDTAAIKLQNLTVTKGAELVVETMPVTRLGDGDINTAWRAKGTGKEETIVVEFNTETPVQLDYYNFSTGTVFKPNVYYPDSWTLRGKLNANDDWTDLSSIDNSNGKVLPATTKTLSDPFGVYADQKYQYFELEFKLTKEYLDFGELIFSGISEPVDEPGVRVETIPIPEDSIKYDAATGNFYLSYTDVTNTACVYYSYSLKKDLSAATLGGYKKRTVAIDSYEAGGSGSSSSSESVDKVVDGKVDTKWCLTKVGDAGVSLDITTSSPVTLSGYSLVTGNDVVYGSSQIRNPRSWVLKAKLYTYEDWTIVSEVNNADNRAMPDDARTESEQFLLNSDSRYKYFRFEFAPPVKGDVMELSELNLYNPSQRQLEYVSPATADTDFYFDGGMKMSTVTATKDNPKLTLLTWETTGGGFEHYEVYRKNSATGKWDLIADTPEMAYQDYDAPIGKDCQYKVIGILDCKVKVTDESKEATGRRYEYGSVSGHVTYLDGVGCPGYKVNITKKGDSKPTVSTTTADDGSFLLDHVLFNSEGITYTIDVEGVGNRNVSLNGSEPIITAFEFKNEKAVRFSGHVYYTGSTVPVRHANFEVNGHKVLTAGGQPVETNASGDFSFLLPKEQSMNVRVVMDGHTFMDNGDVEMNGEKQFSLTGSLDNYVFYDNTKVRLIGRMVGGAIEAQKPLGLDLSENNLGDNPTLVLELEGDNISHLVFEPTDLTIKERNDTIQHNGHQTTMLTEAKRITIRPDSLSGEYQVDLFPTKYKVVQATAQGYSSLLPAGTAMPSLDLSQSIVAKRDTVKQNFDLGILNDTYVDYNDKYSVVYRSPISLTYKQVVNSLETNYLGEKTFNKVAMVDDNGVYTFGHPVFNSDKSYTLRVSAHEDYYYNNDIQNVARHTMVPITNHDMRIYNGMNQSLAPQYAHLDDKGQTTILLKVDNPTFTLNGDKALRSVEMSIDVDGLYVQCEPLEGFVLGQRLKGKDYIQKFNTVPVAIDVVRDPQGAKSYAWMERGSSLNLEFSQNWTFRAGVQLNFGFGQAQWVGAGIVGAPMGVGGYSGTTIQSETTASTGLDIATSWHGSSFHKYKFQTSDRIQTSSDPTMVGAPADIYVGTEVVAVLAETDAATVIDGQYYRLLENAINEGKIRILARHETEKDSLYLVNMTQMAYGNDISGSFAYTQKHIVNEILPHLLTERNALLLTKQPDVDYQAMANKEKKNIYVSNSTSDANDFGTNYEVYTPDGKDFTVYPNEVDGYNAQMQAWIDMIGANEEKKLDAVSKGSLLGTYEVSSGVNRQYSETTSASGSSTWTWDGAGGLAGGIAAGLGKFFAQVYSEQRDNAGKKTHTSFSFKAFGLNISLGFAPIIDINSHQTEVDETGNSKTAGFVLSMADDCYEVIDVYRVTNDMYSDHEDFNETVKEDREGSEEVVDDEVNEDRMYADFVYIRRAGATRNPYEGAEVTIAHKIGTEICPATLKIDNPTIKFDKHEVSNIPADEKATFAVTLSNESEINDGRDMVGTKFVLYQDRTSNPDGLKIMLDGKPVVDGVGFVLKPGESIVKTIEVIRGVAYDYSDVKLILESSNDIMVSNKAAFSVHYLPVSCPVTMQLPVQNWVMNTKSAQDKDGYYIPVEINGFDVNYDNFDHIELQYKLKSDAEDRWVNLCSYYASDSLYKIASGNKAMIENGRITNARFYGERDPMEQYYDLRAVSFCRLGTGFVNRSSEVKSGLKDTRRPELFGAVSPKNGILQVGDYISIPFSEDIAANYLDALYNFQITGYTNKTGLTSSTSLNFSGSDTESATTSVTRNLSDVNFTIDLMVKPADLDKQMPYFTQGTKDKYVTFGQTADHRLYMTMKTPMATETVYSKPVDMGNDWVRVAASYDREQMTDNVQFWLDTHTVDLEPRTDGRPNGLPWNYNGVGKLMLGSEIFGGHHYEGSMLEVRLWAKKLDRNDMVVTDRKTLSGYEPNLRAYYPMNDATNLTSVKDKANGATITLNGQTWNKPEGISVRVEPGKPALALDGHKFSASSTSDYTITFWYKQMEVASDTVALMASGRGIANEPAADSKIFIGLAPDGNVILQHNGITAIGEGAFNNLEWHNVALTVNRGLNLVNFYVDDKPVAQLPASDFGALDCDSLWLGLCHWKTLREDGSTLNQAKHYDFNGLFGEVTMWNSALPATYLSQYYGQAPNNEELSLVNHLSFSKRQIDSHNEYQTVYNPLNKKVNRDENGNKIEPKESDRLVLTADADVQTSTDVAPVRDQLDLTNMNFSWVGKDNELLINLKMPDAEINKQNVFVTVRDVEDKAGNTMESPLSWTIFVDRNVLRWGSEYVDMTLDHSQSKVFMVEVRNNAATTMNYTITDLPSWLKVDYPEGILSPTEATPLNFTVSDELDPGEHDAVIYLKDQNGLSEPLRIYLCVNAVKPTWAVDPLKYNESMNLIGRVDVLEYVDNSGNAIQYVDQNPEDIVGAFINEECVGLAKISINTDPSALYMTIYGASTQYDAGGKKIAEGTEGSPVTFQLWREQTGKIYYLHLTPDNAVSEITFKADAVYGSPEEPVKFVTSDNAVQNVVLNKGWNWVSFGVQPYTLGENFSSAFVKDYEFSDHDFIKSLGFTAEYLNGKWISDAAQFVHTQSYMFRVAEPGILGVNGSVLKTDAERTLKLNPGWNYLPYLCNQTLTITDAMADYYDKATPGDIVKAYNSFVMFSNDKKWIGSLQQMQPGVGYMLMRNASTSTNFTYYDYANRSSARSRSFEGENSADELECVLTRSHNMPVLATALSANGTEAQQGDILSAYVGDELVGHAKADAEGRFFLMTSADEGADMHFTLTTAYGEETSAPMLRYNSNGSAGTLSNPFRIDFTQSEVSVYPTKIRDHVNFAVRAADGQDVTIFLYDASGYLHFQQTLKAQGGYASYTLRGLDTYAQGVYVAVVKVDGKETKVKLIK